MKIAILTFQFAYNYGAMLQAYALRSYLLSLGNEAEVVPFVPIHLRKAYSINPFEKGISFKHRISNAVFYRKHAHQARRFEEFKKGILLDTEFSDPDKVITFLKEYDVLICGSDQIWNDKITGETTYIYWGGNIRIRKISYAASLGSRILDEVQKSMVEKYLPSFDAVSIREESTRKLIQGIRDDIIVTCDPVFLLSTAEWKKKEKTIDIEKDYLLLYLLEDNQQLIYEAKKYARKNNLHIYEIHPTLSIHHNGIPLLKNVGPQEFLFLIDNAKAVCTNSFHAVSFCIIFGKYLIHIPNSKSPERTQNLLTQCGIVMDNGMYYNLKKTLRSLGQFIDQSKNFLQKSLRSE